MNYAQASCLYKQPLSGAAGSVQFSRMHQHRLSAQSLSECHFAPPGGNFALVTSKLDPSCHGKVSKEAIGIALPVAATPLTVVGSMNWQPVGWMHHTGLVGTQRHVPQTVADGIWS